MSALPAIRVAMTTRALVPLLLLSGCFTSVQQIADGPCVPKTCIELGKNCGDVADGCGGTVACGGCAVDEVCGARTENVCSCQPRTCAQLSASCGSPADGCGGTLSCGQCAAGASCGATFTCTPLVATPPCTSGVCVTDPVLTALTLRSVASSAPNEAWAVGEGGVALFLSPLGNRLETTPAGTTQPLVDVAIGAQGEVWAVGPRGAVRRTSAGWVSVPFNGAAQPLIAVAFGQGQVFALSTQALFRFDGTALVKEDLPGVPSGLRDVAVTTTHVLVLRSGWQSSPAEGNDAIHSRPLAGGPWQAASMIATKWSLAPCPDGSVLAVGSYSNEFGDVVRWRDGTVRSEGRGDPIAEAGVGVRNAVCLGDGSVWAHASYRLGRLENGGSGASPRFAVSGLEAMAGTRADDVWFVGSAGAVLHFDGTTLRSPHGPASRARRTLTAASASNVWILGPGGSAEHYDGTQWTPIPTGELAEDLSGAALGPDGVWVVGHQSRLGRARVLRGSRAGWEVMRPLAGEGVAWSRRVPTSIGVTPAGEVLATSYESPSFVSSTLRWAGGTSWTEAPMPDSLQLAGAGPQLLGWVNNFSAPSSETYVWQAGAWQKHTNGLSSVNGLSAGTNGSLFAATGLGLGRYLGNGWSFDGGAPKAAWSSVAVEGSTAWAVGATSADGQPSRGVFAYFDGSTWVQVPVPTDDPLVSVAVTTKDVWMLSQNGLLLRLKR